MSLATPTTQQIQDNIVAQVSSKISQTIPLFPKAFTRVFAAALAGIFILLYKYGGFTFLQIFVATATWDETEVNGKKIRPLVEWGRLIGVGDPLDAQPAQLLVRVTVTNQVGSLPGGSQLLRTETQVLYQSVAARVLDAATVDITVKASSDRDGNGGVGSIGNLQAGDIIQFANPLPNVKRDVVVLSQSVTGADAETLEAYRQRIVRRFQRKPQGGAYADYAGWSESVPGIVAAYPYTGAPGEVDVYVEASEASSGSPDGIPTGAQLAAVVAAINYDVNGLASNRPANAAVNVLAITRKPFNFTVVGLTAPDLPAAKETLEAAVDDHLRSREPYIEGLSSLPRLDRVTAAAIGGVIDDAVSAVGGTVTSVVLLDGITTLNAYTLGRGETCRAGAFTYP
jgi:uncharacterized phage protein gp47/JayE